MPKKLKEDVFTSAKTEKTLIKRILERVKYPKFILLIITFGIAYMLYRGMGIPFHNQILEIGYAGAFLSGVFFVYSFTAAPATAVLLLLAKSQNIVLTGIIAGFGALLGDLFIFKFVRLSFADEIQKVSQERIFKKIRDFIPDLVEKYFIPVFAGFLVASPLPDEIGVTLLATTRQVSTEVFGILAYLLNTVGIFIVLLIGRSI